MARNPREEYDLASKEPERVRTMSEELRRAVQRLAPGGDTAQSSPITAEQEQRLRSLGYLF